MKIAFDINGTLKRVNEEETKAMVTLLKILKNAGHFIIVWSGDGISEINKFITEYELSDYVDIACNKLDSDPKNMPDIAFDDSEFAYLAKKVNIKV
jgi:phosphoglycolate phosphatase-like HAD superfamily hydrolase